MFGLWYRKQDKVLKKLYEEKHRLEDICEIDDNDENNKNVEQIIAKINAFIEEDFAKLVFEHYSRKKPMLYENFTGEKVTWEQAFGKDFGQVSKSLRHSLVGLLTGDGRYSLK